MIVSSTESQRIIKETYGIEPVNPMGTCFDSTCVQAFIWAKKENRTDFMVCHGVGTANAPGQEGGRIAHAWLEWNGDAYDTTWAAKTRACDYHEQLQLRGVVMYTWQEFEKMVLKYDFGGPWDEYVINALSGEDAEYTRKRINQIIGRCK